MVFYINHIPGFPMLYPLPASISGLVYERGKEGEGWRKGSHPWQIWWSLKFAVEPQAKVKGAANIWKEKINKLVCLPVGMRGKGLRDRGLWDRVVGKWTMSFFRLLLMHIAKGPRCKWSNWSWPGRQSWIWKLSLNCQPNIRGSVSWTLSTLAVVSPYLDSLSISTG